MKKLMLLMVLLCGGLDGAEVQTVSRMPEHVVAEVPAVSAEGTPRNVILMIGDGMGAEHISAAWLCNKGKLNITGLPYTGLCITCSANRAVTDSAAAGTALAAGVKTNNGMVGQTPDRACPESLAALFRVAGKATGLVVTKAITDATPAAFYAHTASRKNTAAIAEALAGAGFDVVLGGGAAAFSREQMAQMRDGGADVELFAPGDCAPASERGDLLVCCTRRALSRLEKADTGFFLMVEGSSIDMAAHANNLEETVREVLDFDRAVGAVLEWMQHHPDSLLVVTADHQTGGLSILDGDRKKGVVKGSFSTTGHSGVAVPIYAIGVGASIFCGVMENTDVPRRILGVTAQK